MGNPQWLDCGLNTSSHLITKPKPKNPKTRALGEMTDSGRFSAHGKECVRDIYRTRNKGAVKDDLSHIYSKRLQVGKDGTISVSVSKITVVD